MNLKKKMFKKNHDLIKWKPRKWTTIEYSSKKAKRKKNTWLEASRSFTKRKSGGANGVEILGSGPISTYRLEPVSIAYELNSICGEQLVKE